MTDGLSALVPPVVQVAQSTVDVTTDVLFPAEAAAVADAVPKRVAEFTTVRTCARRALSRLGVPPSPLLPGRFREPLWPAGVVGSLTHCDGYRAAAVALANDIAALGIDVEPNVPLPAGVAELVTIGDELSALRHLHETEPRISWDKLLFSAKESVYKAWFPLTGVWLDFTDCELTIDTTNGTFTGCLLVPGPILGDSQMEVFSGRWTIEGDHILTAVCEPAP